ncbi:MAG TPA: DNA primase [Saprospiraceae bacterium]|nr:DNA primase [Saprospiraceae bacterium]
MSISKKSIQQVLETAQIEDVVGEFVQLKKSGPRLKGLCPFHNEKTPSFTVTPSLNMYKCFGCGNGGDPVKFLREHEKFTFIEAIEWLANKYGITLEKTVYSDEQQQKYKEEESLYIINSFAQDYFVKQLHETDEGRKIALPYFKERGFREDTIKKFGLGYTPYTKDGLLQAALNHGFKEESLKKLGLVSKSSGMDFFRNRVMFPIKSVSGKVIAFAGRIMGNHKKAPKYINSPETEIYIKSKIVYGIYEAKKSIRKEDECLLVEGYTDVISLHQNGIENVVASSGTSLTVEQLQLIKRNTSNLKIIYDGDAAGVNAALRGLDLALEQDLNVNIVMLPEGQDPDSFIKQVGATVFRTYLAENSDDFIFFKLRLLEKDADDPVKKTAMIKDIISSIGRIPDPLKRNLYIKECAQKLQIDEAILIGETNKVVKAQVFNRQKEINRQQREKERKAATDASFPQEPPPFLGDGEQPPPDELYSEFASAKKTESKPSYFREREIVRVLVQHGDKKMLTEDMTVAAYVVSEIGETFDGFEHEDYRAMVVLCRQLVEQSKPVNYKTYSIHENDAFREIAQELVISKYEMSPNWITKKDMPLRSQPIPEENFRRDAIREVKKLKLAWLKKIAQQNTERIKKMPQDDIDDMLKLLKTQQNINKAITELTKELNQVIL